MQVLVTGGTGLVGAHTIVELLRRGKRVVALVRDREKLLRCLQPFAVSLDKLQTVSGDITQPDSVAAAMADCDALIHCAGFYSNNPDDKQRLVQTNVEGSRTVLQLAVAKKLDPIVHISSILALFPPRGVVQSADDNLAQPTEMYTRTKVDAETIARHLQAQGQPVVTVYPGSIQGPNDPTFSTGMQFMQNEINTGKVLVTEGGRVFTDVRDLAQLLDRLLVPGQGPRRYMFGGYYLTYPEYHAMLCKVTGKELQQQKIPGWLMRCLGSINDRVGKLTGKPTLLTREAAEVLTRSVPCDDSRAIDEFQLQLVGVEQSFRDLVDWMRQAGHID